jgi:hypothetical protein
MVSGSHLPSLLRSASSGGSSAHACDVVRAQTCVMSTLRQAYDAFIRHRDSVAFPEWCRARISIAAFFCNDSDVGGSSLVSTRLVYTHDASRDSPQCGARVHGLVFCCRARYTYVSRKLFVTYTSSRISRAGATPPPNWRFSNNHYNLTLPNNRWAWVHINSTIYDNSVAHPLVLAFHGAGAGAGTMEDLTGLSNPGISINGRDIVVVYGQSTLGTNGENGEFETAPCGVVVTDGMGQRGRAPPTPLLA